MNFADRLIASIAQSKSFIVAGFDPQIEAFPQCILDDAAKRTSSNDEAVYAALVNFHQLALDALVGKVAAVKPNIAFFEQYGIAGLRAFASICSMIKERKLPIIADIKRGDIGSTAQAYSSAYLGQVSLFGKKQAVFDVDAITISPYLGFDTVETYFKDCQEFGKGLFVLVKTSNPGSASIQGLKLQSGQKVAETVATWLADKGAGFLGTSGYSGLGAVVGATYPDEARALRKLMPNNFFLIPGMGAQGGTAQDAVAGFSANKSGAIINISRGLLGTIESAIERNSIAPLVGQRADEFNRQVAAALQ